MRNPTVMLASFLVLASAPAAAQDSPFPRCSPPHEELGEFQERLMRLAIPGGDVSIDRLVSSAFTPNLDHLCPILSDEIDLGRALDELTRWVARSGRGWLERGFFMGLGSALRLDPSREAPLEALGFAVEEGATDHGRSHALTVVVGLAERHPEVRRYLVARASAPHGPPAWPELPEAIVRAAYLAPASSHHAALRAALEAESEGIANPRVRCWVERGGVPGERAPGVPPPCPVG